MPEEQKEWPDNSPEVTFDINLGKKVEYIDFNPYKFNALLDKLGAEDQDKSKLQVVFKNRVKSYGTNYSGTYDTRRQVAEIRVYPEYRKWTNKTLIHETQHFVDDMNDVGKVSRLSEAAKILAILAIIDGSTHIGVGSFDNEIINQLEFPAMLVLSIAALSLYRKYRYQTDPQEVRAHKIESKKKIIKRYGDIVTFKPKQAVQP